MKKVLKKSMNPKKDNFRREKSNKKKKVKRV